ncbi:MAG: F0F1 ATP synthase subunit A [Acidimicrobiia bacterium]|nr:MAG: F0F1 ATP synthase subunit A [Acidimicrobiia bacterium]
MELILASAECNPAVDIICAPADVNELFEYREAIFSLGPFPFTRTVILILGIALIVSALLYFGLRKKALVPGKFQTVVEGIVGFVRDDVAIEIIGEHGAKYAPWLLSVFLFVLVGNMFEITPFISFPVTSRMALPVMLAAITWVVFVVAGIKRQGFGYFLGIVWPKSVPIALRPLVGLIEFFSILFLRPITLAIRLFANLVAGHLMLALLLVSGWVFISNIGEIGPRAGIGLAWFTMGLGIYMFEIVVIILQAYIFTLLSAVYVQTSLYPDH